MEDNIKLLKQTYEYKFYLNNIRWALIVGSLMFVPMLVASIASWDFANFLIPIMLIIVLVFSLCGLAYWYQIKELMKYPETYSRLEATVVSLGYAANTKKHTLTLWLTTENGTDLELDTTGVYSYFKAKSLVDKKVFVLYNTFDERVAVIKTDV